MEDSLKNDNQEQKVSVELFESYPVPKALAALCLPTVLSMLVTIFYNMADTFFVGQTGDPNQVAAVSLTTPVFLFFLAAGNIFGIGGSTMISRLLGQGDHKTPKNVSSFCIFGCIAIGAILSLAIIFGMPVVLGLIGTNTDTYGFAKDYLFNIALGGIFIVISTAMGNIVRGEGAAKASMAGMMIGTIVNMVLDPIMILLLGMGVSGAAVATIIGNICSVVFYAVYLIRRRGRTVLSMSPKDLRFSGIAGGVLSIGLPASFNNVLMSVSNILLNVFLSKYGNAPIAAMGVAMKSNMLVVMLQLGIGIGMQPLVGYCYGAGNREKLSKVMKTAALCNFFIGTALTVFYLFACRSIVGAFIDEPAVVEYGVTMLRALMISGPLIGIMFVFSFTFQAMGKAVPSLILSVSRQGFVFLPVLFLGDRLFGLNGIVYAQPCADIGSLIIAAVMFVVIMKKKEPESVQV